MARFLAALAALATASTSFGQAVSPVVGVGTFIHVVANLDKTIQFYGNDLGLELTGAAGPRAFAANAVVEGLYDAKGSQSRVAVLKIPGSPLGVEFVEFKDASQKPVHPNIQDPGASMLVLQVRDLNAVMLRLEQDGAPVIGAGVVKDPDGFFVELVQSPESGAKLMLTVDSTDRTLRLFRDLLGFQPEVGQSFVKDKDRLKKLGLRNASYRSSAAKVPGTSFEVDFIEFKGIERHPVSAGIHDPGGGVLRLVVRDVDALLSTLKSAGVPVVSVGGELVTLGARHFVILRDPDGFFFQLFPGPAPVAK
jgi:catechol 2,3-dioxygenase-like lactoylglutathione lyase family enzyme